MAHAQKKKDKVPDLIFKDAYRLFSEGRVLVRQKRYSEAVSKFQASYRVLNSEKPSHQIVRNALHLYIGRTFHLMKKYTKARDNYRQYLSLVKKGKRREKVEGWLASIAPHLSATVDLKSTPSAECEVKHPGGVWKGSSPAKIKVEAGEIKIRCEKEKYAPQRANLQITPHTSSTQNFILVLIPPKRIKPKIPVEAPKANRSWIGLVVAGAGVAALIGGGVVGFLASNDSQESAKQREALLQKGNMTIEDTRTIKELDQQAQNKAFIANILYASGGGLAITGIILYLVLRPSGKAASRATSKSIKKRDIHAFCSFVYQKKCRIIPPSYSNIHRIQLYP